MRKCLLCCLALTLCFAILFSLSVCAGGISVDGYIQPEEWAHASFATLFTSEQESGCAVSYADFRVLADAASGRVCFALQVIDEAFAGSRSLSRVHIGIDNATFSFTADGVFQATGDSHTVQSAGFYQDGGYNRDYVLEAVIISPQALRGGKFPVSVWFTDGVGARSAVCELTVDTGLPPETTASTAPQTDAPITEPRPSISEPLAPVRPTDREEPSAGAVHTTARAYATTVQGYRTQSTAGNAATPKPETDARPRSETGTRGAAAAAPSAAPEHALSEGETSDFMIEEVSIPATGEKGAGHWSVKRIAACAMAGACVVAAALLFVIQAHKKEKQAEPKG